MVNSRRSTIVGGDAVAPVKKQPARHVDIAAIDYGSNDVASSIWTRLSDP